MTRPSDDTPSGLTPYADLTPPLVLDALDSVGLRGDGRLLQLNSYENRVFQVYLEDGSAVVTKFYRPGRWSDEQILEEHAFGMELAAAEIPVVAPLVLVPSSDAALPVAVRGEPATLATVSHGESVYRFSVSPCRPGRPPPLESPTDLEWIGRFIGRIHAAGARAPFRHRKTFSVDEFGFAARDRLWRADVIPTHAAPGWKAMVDEALGMAARAFEQTASMPLLRLHGDCHAGNILWTEHGPHFVDLDDAMNGYAIQDLWMLLSGEPGAARQQIRALLSGYELFHDFDDRQIGLVEALRTIRMVHHSAWIAARWTDPAFPAAFPWFGEGSYWQQQTQDLGEQVVRMASAGRA
jgi:Ser/Thr protein kinase RdoA (MazF antagonist)